MPFNDSGGNFDCVPCIQDSPPSVPNTGLAVLQEAGKSMKQSQMHNNSQQLMIE